MLVRRQFTQLLGGSLALASTSFSSMALAIENAPRADALSQLRSASLPSADTFKEVIGMSFQSKKVNFDGHFSDTTQNSALVLKAVQIPNSDHPEQFILRFKSPSIASSNEGIHQLRNGGTELLLYLDPVFTEGTGEYYDAVINTQMHA